MKKKKHTKRKLPYKALIKLQEASDAYNDKDYLDALEILEELNSEYPNRAEILGELFNVYAMLQDNQGYQRSAEKLLKIEGASPEVLYGLAGAYAMNGRIALSVRTYKDFLKHYPTNEYADKAQKQLERLSKFLEEMLDEIGLSAEVEFAEKHEEVQCFMERGELEKGIELAEELLEERPEFVPVRNNLSMMLDMDGQTDAAIEQAKEVLAQKPDNIHALSNLTQFLFLEGRTEEARESAERLKSVQVKELDHFIKKAEALSKLGDDEGVKLVWREAKNEGVTERPDSAFLYHLAAASTMRSGDEKEAKRLWKKALDFQPALSMAQGNYYNLSLPVGERDAPWHFTASYWLRSGKFKELNENLKTNRGRSNEERTKQNFREFLEKHPSIVKLIPVLLDRADPTAKELALMLIDMSRFPALVEFAKDFGLSQHGADQWRHRAAQIASDEGLLSKEKARMWIRGEWQEIMFIETKIDDEPSYVHEPKVLELIAEGIEAMHEKEFELAEEFFTEALALEPDSPSIQQNIAATFEHRGRHEEAIAAIRKVNEQHPDYVFAAVALARIALEKNRISEAEELLKPLFTRPHFHYSEYDAFAEVQIELHIARKDMRSARQVLQTWSEMNDEVDVDYWEMRMSQQSILKKLFGFGKKL